MASFISIAGEMQTPCQLSNQGYTSYIHDAGVALFVDADDLKPVVACGPGERIGIRYTRNLKARILTVC
jgi:hypothetical protein